ncbi:MAG: IS4 family transposase [Roseivirga sp.]
MANDAGFIKRSRKLTASSFVNTLMFSFNNHSKTSLEDITADLDQQFSIQLSKEALHKRFTSEGVDFMQRMVKSQLSRQFKLPLEKGLKSAFRFIKIKDSTKFTLPDNYNGDYPGFGNFSKKHGLMNLQYEYDLVSGNWECIELTNVKRNDQRDSKETISSIEKGGLYIRDLGYITPTYLKAVMDEGSYFLNRMPSQVNLYTPEKKVIDFADIDRKFKGMSGNSLDMDVLIYKEHSLCCRVIIDRVSDQEYSKRLKHALKSAKRRSVGISNKHKIRCRYDVYITNVDRKTLPIKKIRNTYYLRWQIEIVFKTWKSFLELHKVKKVKKERFECQLLAKLLWVLLNWQLLSCCNTYLRKERPETGISLIKFFKRCLAFSHSIRLVILKKTKISECLNHVLLPLIDNTVCENRRGKQTYYQVLNDLQYGLS